MAAYESGSSSLSTILKNPLLSLERISQTTDSLSDALASQEEVDAAVRAVVGVATDVDEDELEKELTDLMQEEENARIKAEEQKIWEQRSLEEKARQDAKKDSERKKAQAETRELEQQRAREEAIRRAKQEERPGEWEERYANAQQRQAEEKQRAEAERLKIDERRLAAG